MEEVNQKIVIASRRSNPDSAAGLLRSRCSLAMTMIVCLLGFSALAADQTPSTYSPDYCEFAVTFPGDPYTTRRCDDENKNKCYDLISYTQVFDMASTVNFRVICNP